MHQLEGREKWVFSVANGIMPSSEPLFLLKPAKINSYSVFIAAEKGIKLKPIRTNDLSKNNTENKKKQSDFIPSDNHTHPRVYLSI